MPRTSSKLLVSLLVAAVGLAIAAPEAFAKKRRAGKAKAKPAAAAPVSDSLDSAAEVSAATSGARPSAAQPEAPRAATPAPKPRVYTFGGFDVNGNLKAPQLLFFRGRVKQELDTSSPEKRSFLKELEKTADAKGL